MFNSRSDKYSFFIFAYWHDRRWKKFVGATVKIWDLAHSLGRQGHQVHVFLPKYNFDTKIHNRVKIIEVPLVDLPLIRYLTFSIFLVFKFISETRKTRPNVIYSRRMNSILPALFARYIHALFFYEVNDDPYGKIVKPSKRIVDWMRSAVQRTQDDINLRLSSHAFIITEEIAAKINQRIRAIIPQNITILPSGSNTNLFSPKPVRAARQKLKLDVDEIIIGFVGTLLRHQGIHVLIDAFPMILKKYPSSVCLIIGEGPMKEEWMACVRKASLDKHFRFLGQIDYPQLPDWINAMDVCVAPYLKSAGLRSPVKVFDYMACGKPVVASRIPGTTTLFENSSVAVLVEPEDPKCLAGAVVQLLLDKERSRKMGNKACDLVTSEFDRAMLAKRVTKAVKHCS